MNTLYDIGLPRTLALVRPWAVALCCLVLGGCLETSDGGSVSTSGSRDTPGDTGGNGDGDGDADGDTLDAVMVGTPGPRPLPAPDQAPDQQPGQDSDEPTGDDESDTPIGPPSDDSADFDFDEAFMSEDGVIHFFESASARVHRLDLVSREWLEPLEGSATATAFAAAPAGDVVYLAYTGGRIEEFDTDTGEATFLGAAPADISSMMVVEQYLFTIDGSGSWDTQALYDRATGARLYSDDWRDTSRSMLWAPGLAKIFFINSGVSPTDLNSIVVDLDAGTFEAELDSPYHGDYRFPGPLRLTPDESAVITGAGNHFSTADLSYVTSFGLNFSDLVFDGDDLLLLDPIGETSAQVRRLDADFNIDEADYYDGEARRIFIWDGELVVITRDGAGIAVYYTPL